MQTEFEKAQANKILGAYQENDLEKSKYKKVIHVHTQHGDYNRVQLVGSEKAPLSSKHHGMDSLFGDEKKQKDYEDHLHSLVQRKGKYYKLEDKKHAESGGRSGSDFGKHKGATEYKLHADEIAYKKKIHEDRKTKDDEVDETDFKNRTLDDNYHGTSDVKNTAAFSLLDKREKTPDDELHKKANDKVGRGIKKDEETQAQSESAKQRTIQKDYWNKSTKTITKELSDFDYENSTVKDLASLVQLKLRRLAVLKPDMKVSYINSKGEKKTGDWSAFRDWLVSKAAEPSAKTTKLIFKDVQIDYGDNPYSTSEKES
jgi:hypothetical protein